MFRTLPCQSLGLVALCLLLLGQNSLRADDVSPARRLPPGALVYVSVPDAIDLKDRFMESSLGQMVQDESLTEFWDQFAGKLEEASREVQEETGLSLSDLTSLLHGDVTVALLQPPGGALGGVLMLDYGEHQDTLDAILEKMHEEMENDGVTRTVETIEGTDVTVLTKPDEEDDPDTLAYFFKDQHLVASMSTSIDLLQEVLIRWDGEHDQTFADEEVFSTIMRNCQAEQSQFQWYFSPIDLFRSVAMLPQLNQGGVSPQMAIGFLPALGLDKFKAIGGASSVGTDQFDTVTHTYLYVDQPTSGIVKFFECPATRQSPPAWVPADVSAYTSANWGITGAYEAVEAMVDFFQPPGTFANAVDQLAQQGPRIHIKDDVIDSLTGKLQMFGETGEDFDAQAAQPGVFALELRDADKMADILQRVADITQGQFTTRDFRGTTIYETDIPNMQGGAPQSLGVAVAKDQLFIAVDVQSLEEYLRIDQAEQPLSDSTEYRRVSAHFPSLTSIVGFGRTAAQLKPIYEQLRTGEFEDVVDGAEEIDFSLLPEFDKLADYFTTTGNYAVPAENGALFVNFSLRND